MSRNGFVPDAILLRPQAGASEALGWSRLRPRGPALHPPGWHEHHGMREMNTMQ